MIVGAARLEVRLKKETWPATSLTHATYSNLMLLAREDFDMVMERMRKDGKAPGKTRGSISATRRAHSASGGRCSTFEKAVRLNKLIGRALPAARALPMPMLQLTTPTPRACVPWEETQSLRLRLRSHRSWHRRRPLPQQRRSCRLDRERNFGYGDGNFDIRDSVYHWYSVNPYAETADMTERRHDAYTLTQL